MNYTELSEARFQFALKCLRTVVQIKTSENVVFSPYSIYDGLFLTYLAFESDHDIKKNKRILQLSWKVHKNTSKRVWMAHKDERRRKDTEMRSKEYYDINSFWLKNTLKLQDDLFDRYEKFNKYNFPNLMSRINEVLRDEMQGYFSQPVKLNRVHENMEFILSSVARFKGDIFRPDLHTDVPNTYRSLERPRTVISPKLGMFVTELHIKTASLFLLFPAVQSCIPNCWEVDQNISGLVERLTTKEGADELHKLLDKQESSAEKLSAGSVIYPDIFELENDLPLEELLETLSIQLLDLDKASGPNFSHEKPLNLSHEKPLDLSHEKPPDLSHENQHFGDMHRAYIKVTSENVIAGAANMIFSKNQGSLESIEKTNYSECKNSFVSLIYDRVSRNILFIGIMNKNIELPEVSKRRAQRYFVEHK